jgi:riboflavin synthase
MFTGIIAEAGRLEKITKISSLTKLEIASKIVYADVKVSDSIAVNGICLTVVKKDKGLIYFDAITSTVAVTNIKDAKRGDSVNLEPALKVGDKLGGHFVLGHIDTTAKLLRQIKHSDYWELVIDLPAAFRKFVIKNGSIALEGVSLTVKNISGRYPAVNIIPFTYENTNLKYKKTGALLNVEFDYLLKKNLA